MSRHVAVHRLRVPPDHDSIIDYATLRLGICTGMALTRLDCPVLARTLIYNSGIIITIAAFKSNITGYDAVVQCSAPRQ